MAYFSGSTNSFADLKTTLETLLTSNGWATSDGILNKDGAYIKFTSATTQLLLEAGTGQSTSTLTDAAPSTASSKIMSNTTNPFTWPINYELFILENPHEWYLVVNYNSEYYQFLQFGFGDLPGVGPLCFHFSGSHASLAPNNQSDSNTMSLYTELSYVTLLGTRQANVHFGFFASHFNSISNNFPGAIYNSLNSVGWKYWKTSTETSAIKMGSLYAISSLISSLPNVLNQTTVLLPVKILVGRGSNMVSLAAEMRHARFCRIDNIEPGSIITYGAEQWKIFPFYRKNIATRDGSYSGFGANHSGTFGVAIRYDGV